MTKDKRPLTSHEQALWRRVTAGISPLSPAVRIRLPREAKPSSGVSRITRQARGTDLFRSPNPAGITRRLERRLRRGHLIYEARLDLHGFRREEAYSELVRFVTGARTRNLRCVLVITGKGNSVPTGGGTGGGTGILRTLLLRWIREDPALSAQVIDCRTAHRKHGGQGAFYLWLRRRP